MDNVVILGIGDHHTTNTPGTVIKTFSLGSCVALMLFHQITRTCAMAHVALADSNFGHVLKKNKPGYYADTAVPCLIAEIQKFAGLGPKSTLGIQAKIAGGSEALAKKAYDFKIGKRIEEALRALLQQHKIALVSADTGGTLGRTVAIRPEDDIVTISSSGKSNWVI